MFIQEKKADDLVSRGRSQPLSARARISHLLRTGRVLNSCSMKVDLGIWDKLTKVVIFLLFLAGVLGLAVWYLPLIKQNERMRKQILLLDAQIQKRKETGKQLEASIDALYRDPKAIERLARTWGYAKPGETVIRFEERGTNHLR